MTDRSANVVVVFVLVGVAVLGAVVVLAMGRGGELAETHADHPPLPLPEGRHLTASELAHLRLPRAAWGYQVTVTDEALRRLSGALNERDLRLAVLERQLDDLRRRLGEQERPERIGALHGIQEQVAANNGALRGSEDGAGDEPAGEDGS
ncbi:hypothetical protein [Actinomadura terrae]|uniref:hypothetical protein n=1 Tax=Actinomadura terrae TaxID=604353 RepID=UPI001FA7A632|nr:hypothetical protein [Actinomadura terrae]